MLAPGNGYNSELKHLFIDLARSGCYTVDKDRNTGPLEYAKKRIKVHTNLGMVWFRGCTQG